MGRVMGVIASFLAVLTVIWFCCGNGIPRVFAQQQPQLPQFSSEPAQEHLPTVDHAALEIGELICYSGNILSEQLTDVAALQLRNTGQQVIVRAEVRIVVGAEELCFAAGYIPPGGTVLVEERQRKPYSYAPVSAVHCTELTMLETEDHFRIQALPAGENGLTVTNLSDQTAPCVRIFYKQYDPQLDLYIGGVTCSVELPRLHSGESRSFWPYGYEQDSAKIVAIVVQQ